MKLIKEKIFQCTRGKTTFIDGDHVSYFESNSFSIF